MPANRQLSIGSSAPASRWSGLTLCLTLTFAVSIAKPVGATVVCPGSSTLQGVDVSKFQGAIDWSQVAAAGYAFAFTRVSDGQLQDPTFTTNYNGIKAAGMIRGAYQFFEPSSDPVAQANLLVADTGPFGSGDLPPALDVEVTGGLTPAALASAIQSWVSTIEVATGRTPIILTSKTFWDANVASAAFSSDPLWTANFSVACPNIPAAWVNWTFWLDSASASVPGIGGSVDKDEFNGSIDDLRALAGENPTPARGRSWGNLKTIYR